MIEDDEIMQEVRKAKAKVAQEIGGEGFENYVEYFQKKYTELKTESKVISHSKKATTKIKSRVDTNV